MDVDWQRPMKFDWSGVNGPPFTEEDFNNSVISRILRNEFYGPFKPREFVKKKPWWDPQGKKLVYESCAKYIPGKPQTPQYPQLSTLTKLQHQMGLRVLSSQYKVQPCDYPSPTPNDFESFEKLKEIYEREREEFRVWARLRWVNGDCVRTLHPKPLLETVYEAEYELKKNEVRSLPHKFTMSAQISLETRINDFELQFVKNLTTVNIKSLPIIEYPDELVQDLSIQKPYPLPKPCLQHVSRFKLPRESNVSVLPLPEIHRELANYASLNGAEFIASENALQCCLDLDRCWKLPVSVVNVISPEGGGVKTVMVLGNEFNAQKECAVQRTFKAYRHLLRNAFTKSTDTSKSNGSHDVTIEDKLPSCSSHQNRSTDQPEVSALDKHLRDQVAQSDAKVEQDTITNQIKQKVHIFNLTAKNKTDSDKEPVMDITRTNDTVSEAQKKVRSQSKAEIHQSPNFTFNSNRIKQKENMFHFTASTKTDSGKESDLEISATNDTESENQKKESFQTEAKIHQSPNFAFHSNQNKQKENIFQFTATNDIDSDEEPALEIASTYDTDSEAQKEESIQTETEIYQPPSFYSNNTINVPVPQGERKHINVAGMYIEIDEAQKNNQFKENYQTEAERRRTQNFPFYTNNAMNVANPREAEKQTNVAEMYTEAQVDQITLDTARLSTEDINEIIGVTPSPRKNMNDIDICTCKGTKYETPPPRSFKKWKVRNSASNQSFDLISHSSHKVRQGKKEVILEPIVEWQPELGACKQSAGRLRALALAFMMRPKAKLINVRVDYKNGNVIVIDKLDENVFKQRYGDKRSEIADRIHAVIDQLRFLKPGQYVLAHDPRHGSNAMVYSTLATASFLGAGEHTLSLRPENVYLSDAEEAAFGKIPPELSRAMLPYHKDQGILPLAFTSDEKQVKENKKVSGRLAKVKPPPPAIQPGEAASRSTWPKKKRKNRKRWTAN